MTERVKDFVIWISDYMKDPRIGPSLLLATALYLGALWLRTNQSAQKNKQVKKDEGGNVQSRDPSKDEVGNVQSLYPSITDEVPQDAYQALESEPDSE